MTNHLLRLLALALLIAPPAAAQSQLPTAEIDRIFQDYMLDAHIPGLVYGVVMNGKLAYVQAAGIQDIESKRPVTPETLFRIASMTKAFTALSILKLRDEGKLSLDAPVETYVPELKGWKYPTADSPRIRVRDLLTHTAGFVTDDPWGDRQTPLPEAEFTKILASGVPFTRPPQTAMEYSNLGYALLGRIVANVSKQPYRQFVQQALLTPLGMTSSGYEVSESPQERRALGYRWEDNGWKLEPTMAHGAFGAMGGLQTSANDYAKYVAWLLAAWPPRNDPETGPVRRSSVRELAQGANYPFIRQRPGRSGANACREASTYGMGMRIAADCDLGLTLSHSGGYPGYGSHVLIMADYGIGIFAFANRTYAGPQGAVWDAAVALQRAGFLRPRAVEPDSSLLSAYAAAGRIYHAGSIAGEKKRLAMNFEMDQDEPHWARALKALKEEVGACETSAPITPTGALTGDFTWRCEHGRVRGTLLLAPTRPPTIQELDLQRARQEGM